MPWTRFAIMGFVCVPLAFVTLSSCNPAYILQAASGQMRLTEARRPIAEMLQDPATSPALRAKLQRAQAVVRFAHDELSLPDNGSYRHYVELGRPYAVWNVFAAPEFSLDLRTWCFPVAGCVAYRGYFDEGHAMQYAAGLAAGGDDIYVAGAAAYSTLGFFRDPLLSSVADLPEPSLAGLIFHELAHQQLYVAGDTVFSESFATLIEQEGMVRWLSARGDRAGLCSFLDRLNREREVSALLSDTRSRLLVIYRGLHDGRRTAKAVEFIRLRERYRQLRAGWRGPPYFDAWFGDTLNNATLGAIAAYDDLVGTLRVILEGEGGSLTGFYARARSLARLTAADRARVLRQITTPVDLPVDARCPGGSG